MSDSSTLRAGLPGLGNTCNPGFLEDVLASSKTLERLPDLLRRVERLRFLEDILAPRKTLDALPDWCAASSNGVHDFVLSVSSFPGFLVTV